MLGEDVSDQQYPSLVYETYLLENQVFEQMIDDDVDDENYVQGNRLEMKATKKRPRHQNAFPATANLMGEVFFDILMPVVQRDFSL